MVVSFPTPFLLDVPISGIGDMCTHLLAVISMVVCVWDVGGSVGMFEAQETFQSAA